MIFENAIHRYIHKYLEKKIIYIFFFQSVANHKCTPSDRQVYPYLEVHAPQVRNPCSVPGW